MLVLTRRVGERIFIGDDVMVQVTKVNNGQVSIGIRAPKEVEILREEVLSRNKMKNRYQNEAHDELETIVSDVYHENPDEADLYGNR